MCSIPTFWIGIVFLMIFSVQLGWFPMGMSVPKRCSRRPGDASAEDSPFDFTGTYPEFLAAANVALHTREKLVDVLESDYVLFAKARGESKMECAETPWFPQHYAACGDHAVWLFQRTVRRLCSGRN